jgi:outer membrane protein
VKVGALGSISKSSSNLYTQALAEFPLPGGGSVLTGVGPQAQIPGRGASYTNIYTAAFLGGYYFTPNWSVEVATGFPVWSTVKINGYSAAGPPSETVLGKLIPAAIPITGLYHFTQFGGFQPYLGAGLSPTFALQVRNGYATGGSYEPTVGFIVQGGFDYMFNQHWGVFVDAKQAFVNTTGNSTGINLGPPLGIVTVAGSIKTNARPVSFTTGITYRF